jgi:uncharacterized protein (TIGR02145 family)
MKKTKYEILSGSTSGVTYQLPIFLDASVDEMGIMVGFDGEIEQIEQFCNFTYMISGNTLTIFNTLNTNKLKTLIDSVFTISWGDSSPNTDLLMPTVYDQDLPYASHTYISGDTYDVEITVNSPWKVQKIKRTIIVNGLLQDIDGNTYTTVIIGNQEWLGQNLKTKHYSNGLPIQYLPLNSDWSTDTIGAYAYPSGNTVNFNEYGILYNWHAVNNSSGLVYFTRNGEEELGWRIPTLEDPWNPNSGITYDFDALTVFVGGGATAGGKLKETGFVHWNSPNTGASDLYGFKFLGAGYRNDNGAYGYFKTRGFLWSANMGGYITGRSLFKRVDYNFQYFVTDYSQRTIGRSVRCVRDYPYPIVVDLGTLTFTIPYYEPATTQTQDYLPDYNTLTGCSNNTTISFLALGKSRIDEFKNYGSSNVYSGLTITAEYTGYTIDGLFYMDYPDGYTHITGMTSGYTCEELYQGMITRDEHLIGFLDTPQIFSDIFVERGKQGVMERNLRLGEIDSIGELGIYGSGFFKVKKQ